MKKVTPKVWLIARTMADDAAIARYLRDVGADEYATTRSFHEPDDLVEFAGRMCYRSWQPGLNPNVTRVRDDQAAYIKNILSSAHGSVLEHVTWTFVLQDISRVVTHELVRHRAGTAISQESMRYVRLDDIPMWFPDWAKDDDELMDRARTLMANIEGFQHWMTAHFGLDNPDTKFAEKKAKTSFMRRFAPSGHATSMTWTANARALRHIMEARTAEGAEEEMRIVAGTIAGIMAAQHPMLFGDFDPRDGAWVPTWSKV